MLPDLQQWCLSVIELTREVVLSEMLYVSDTILFSVTVIGLVSSFWNWDSIFILNRQTDTTVLNPVISPEPEVGQTHLNVVKVFRSS